MTLYGGGLRLSEVSSLKVSDIDSDKMQLFIRKMLSSTLKFFQ
jgi:integrase/recombinase XerD